MSARVSGLALARIFFTTFCRHLLQEVGRIVSHQVIDDGGSFLIGQGLDDILLVLQFQVGKDVRRDRLGQDPEDLQAVLVLHVVHDRRDIRRLHVCRCLAQSCVLLRLQQLRQSSLIFQFQFFVFHRAHSFPQMLCTQLLIRSGTGLSPDSARFAMPITSFLPLVKPVPPRRSEPKEPL